MLPLLDLRYLRRWLWRRPLLRFERLLRRRRWRRLDEDLDHVEPLKVLEEVEVADGERRRWLRISPSSKGVTGTTGEHYVCKRKEVCVRIACSTGRGWRFAPYRHRYHLGDLKGYMNTVIQSNKYKNEEEGVMEWAILNLLLFWRTPCPWVPEISHLVQLIRESGMSILEFRYCSYSRFPTWAQKRAGFPVDIIRVRFCKVRTYGVVVIATVAIKIKASLLIKNISTALGHRVRGLFKDISNGGLRA